jgi:hypothetical protein
MFFTSTNLRIKKYNVCITLLNGWKRNLSFVCLVMIGRSSFLNFCLNGKFNQEFCFRIHLLKKGALTTNKGTICFCNEQHKILFKLFFMMIIFIVRNITTKTYRNNVRSWARFFLRLDFFVKPIILLLIPFTPKLLMIIL